MKSTNMLTLNILSVLVVLLSLHSCNFNKDKLLKYDLEKGKLYELSAIKNNYISQIGKNINNTTDSEIRYVLICKVLKRKLSSDYLIEAYFKDNSFSSTKDTIKSGANEIEGLFKQILEKMQDKKFTIEMSQIGRIKSIVGLTQIQNEIIDELKPSSDSIRGSMMSFVSRTFSETMIKKDIEMITAFYPSKKIKSSENWTTYMDLDKSGVEVNTLWSVKDITEERVYLNGVAEVKLKKSTFDYLGSKANYRSDTSYREVEVITDKSSGWVLESDVAMGFEGTIYKESQNALEKDVAIKLNMHTKEKYIGTIKSESYK